MIQTDLMWQTIAVLVDGLIEGKKSNKARLTALKQVKGIMEESGQYPLRPIAGYSPDDLIGCCIADYVRKTERRM